MELRQLRYFIAIAEHRGYRKAALMLHVTQPALTQAMLELESEAGVKLLDRSVRPLTLTKAGEAFLDQARLAIEAAEQSLIMAQRASKGFAGSLRIAFIPGATHHFLPELLKEFKEKNSNMELTVLELTPSAQMKALLLDEIDLGFTRELNDSQRLKLTSMYLFDVPLIAVLPLAFPCAKNIVEVAQLAEKDFVLLPREESPVLYDSIVNLCREAGFSPRITSYPYLAESMLTLVEAEQGIAVLPIWAKTFVSENLQCAFLTPGTVRAELVAAWQSDSHSESVDAFLSLLRDRLSWVRELTERIGI